MRIGISLGSGGARGYAHIGVLRALEEAKVKISLINGSSIGAIIGGAYALHRDSEWLTELVVRLSERMNVHYFNIFRFPADRHPVLRNWLIKGVCDLSALRASALSHRVNRRALKFLFEEHTFAETEIPFSAVAFDLYSCRSVVLSEGRLTDGILPSISIPGIFPPVARDGMLLVDGGVLSDVPARELRAEGATFIIAVKLNEDPPPAPRNAFDLVTLVDYLKGERLSEWQLEAADFDVHVELPQFDSMQFDNYEHAIEAGYRTMRAALPALLAELDGHNG
jgi:NTE family protein